MLVAETETTRKTLHQIHNKGEVTNAWLRKVLLHNTYVWFIHFMTISTPFSKIILYLS